MPSAADMTGRAALGAMVRVGANEQPPATVIDDHFVEIHVVRAAQPARVRRADGAERMVVEIQRTHLGIRRHGIDALLASRAE